MARVRDVSPEELTPELRDIWHRYVTGYGPFEEQLAVFAHVPAALRHLMPMLMELRAAGTLPRRYLELAIVVVSKLNACDYCVDHHGPFLAVEGIPTEALEGLPGRIDHPSLTPIVITHLVITVPIVVWVMISFFEGLPPELEEAALVDGATIWQAFRYVAMPLARPGITVATILSFIFSWNNFIFAMVLAGRETRTLPVAVNNMLTFEQIAWGPLSAAALLVTAPVLILTLVAQKQIVAGLTAGGVKGA